MEAGNRIGHSITTGRRSAQALPIVMISSLAAEPLKGNTVPAKQICPDCSTANEASASRCSQCGRSLDGAPATPPGQTRDVGPYRIIDRIGHGGMGSVYRGRHRDEARARLQGGDVCIKKMHPQLTREEDYRDRFRREAALGRRLEHPGIVKVLDEVTDKGELALVMELVKGRSLARFIGRETGPIPWDRAWPMFAELMDAVAHAHEHEVIHRDLKPENVMVTDAGDIKVLDFGLAKGAGPGATQTGAGLGTVYYMAPEQHYDAKNVDRRADIYALGMTLYVMLAGRLPWGRNVDLLGMLMRKEHAIAPPTDFYPGIPGPVVDVVMTALAFDREDRPATVDELREQLDHADRAARGEAPWPPEGLWASRKEAAVEVENTAHEAPAARGLKPAPPSGLQEEPGAGERLVVEPTGLVAEPTKIEPMDDFHDRPHAPAETVEEKIIHDVGDEAAPAPTHNPYLFVAGIAVGLILAALLVWLVTRGKAAPRKDDGSPEKSSEAEVETEKKPKRTVTFQSPPKPGSGRGKKSRVPDFVRGKKAGIFWHRIEGGPFYLERKTRKPRRQVKIGTFYLARTEVTVAQYRECMEALDGCTRPKFRLRECNRDVPEHAGHPVNCVDWQQAVEFCRWAGGRLPSETEWEYAAGGARRRKFPWGSRTATCDRAVMVDHAPGCGGHTTLEVCSRPLGDSKHGLCDMAGNVRELVADCWQESHDRDPRDGKPWISSPCKSRVARGGSFGDRAAGLRNTTRYRIDGKEAEARFVGFRCAKNTGGADDLEND